MLTPFVMYPAVPIVEQLSRLDGRPHHLLGNDDTSVFPLIDSLMTSLDKRPYSCAFFLTSQTLTHTHTHIYMVDQGANADTDNEIANFSFPCAWCDLVIKWEASGKGFCSAPTVWSWNSARDHNVEQHNDYERRLQQRKIHAECKYPWHHPTVFVFYNRYNHLPLIINS